MTDFLFRFGFRGPQQWLGNVQHGWDDEDSEAFFVNADTSEEALRWGKEVAELLVRDLFEKYGWSGEVPSWKGDQFANWIEDDPNEEYTSEQLQALPRVRHGEIPPWIDLLSRPLKI
ncbi:MAG TPA: hypothetical protein VF215_12335 [Thermoanaerobaculia bacterium]